MDWTNAGRTGKIQREKQLYHGPIFKLVQRQIKTPDQLTVSRDVVLHQPAAAILALTPDNQVVLNTEFRAGVNRESLSLPAGLLNPGEDPLTAAKRELHEETGYIAHDLHELTTITSSEGFTDERVTLVLAKINPQDTVATNFDRDEFVKSQLIPLTQLVDLIKAGTVESAQTVAAVSYYTAFYQT